MTAGISGASEFEDQVSGGKMRVLAVSTDEPVKVGGKEAPTIRDAGFDVVVENWRGVVAPPDILPAERTAMVAALDRLHASPEWEKALERNGWTDFYKPGDEFTRFLAAENRARRPHHRRPGARGVSEPARRDWAGPRAWGLILLGVAVAVLVATTAIRSPEGYAATGPRFVPLLVGVALLLLALLFLARTIVRPDIDLAERAAREGEVTEWRDADRRARRPARLRAAAASRWATCSPPRSSSRPSPALLGSRSPLRDALVGIALALLLFVAFTEFLGVDLPPGLTPIT